jgi:hypothetical protein
METHSCYAIWFSLVCVRVCVRACACVCVRVRVRVRVCVCVCVLGIKPSTSMVGKCSTIELHSQPFLFYFETGSH